MHLHAQRIKRLAADCGGPLAGRSRCISQVAVDKAGAMLGVEEAADCPQRPHPHDRGGAGGMAQEFYTSHHVLSTVQPEGKLCH